MTFKSIPGYPNYEISEEGVVRNINRQSVLKPQTVAKYRAVQLGKGNSRYIHDLVMLTFVGPKQADCVRHLDGDGSNNCLSNLEYGSYCQNSDDRQRHGTWGWKLTDRHIRAIRGLASCGFTYRRLSAIFGVNRNHISQIVRRLRWAHI